MKNAPLAALIAACTVAAALLPAQAQESEIFRHIVCFEFKEETTDEETSKVVEALLDLENKIDTIVDIEWGTSKNAEPLNQGFTHCFLVTFKDKAGLEAYLPHPAHEAFKTMLKPHLEKVFVFDYTPGS